MQNNRRLYRSGSNKIIAGVAGGLADYFEVDPLLIRVLFVLITITGIFGGAGVLLYLALWIFIPPEYGSPTTNEEEIVKQNVEDIKDNAQKLGQEIRNRSFGEDSRKQIGILVIVLGLIFFLNNFGWFRIELFWPILLIIAGIYLLLKGSK